MSRSDRTVVGLRDAGLYPCGRIWARQRDLLAALANNTTHAVEGPSDDVEQALALVEAHEAALDLPTREATDVVISTVHPAAGHPWWER